MADSLADLVVQLSADFGDSAAQLENLADKFDDLGDSASKAADQLNDIQGAAEGAAESSASVGDATKKASDGLEGAGEAAKGAGINFEAFIGIAEKLFGVTISIAGLFETLKESLELSSAFSNAATALGILRNNEAEANEEMEELEATADKFGISFENLIPINQRFAAFGLTVKQTAEMMHLAIEAAAALNGSVENTGRALDLVVSSGIVSRRMLQTLGVSLGDVAKAMHVTEDEAAKVFRSLDIEDRVTAIQAAMEKFAGAGEKQAEGLSGSWARFGNAFKTTLRENGDALAPFAKWLTDAATALLNLDSTWPNLGNGLKGAGDAVVSFEKKLTSVQGVLGVVLGLYEKLFVASTKPLLPPQPPDKSLGVYPEGKSEQKAAQDKLIADAAAALEQELADTKEKIRKEAALAALAQEKEKYEDEAKLGNHSQEEEIAALINFNNRKAQIEVDSINRLQHLPGRMINGEPEATTKRNLDLEAEKKKVQQDAQLENIKIAAREPEELRKIQELIIVQEEEHQKNIIDIKRQGAESAIKTGSITEEAGIQQLKTLNQEELDVTLASLAQQKKLKGKNAEDLQKIDESETAARDAKDKRDAALDEQSAAYRLSLTNDVVKANQIIEDAADTHSRNMISASRKMNESLLSDHRLTNAEWLDQERALNAQEDALDKAENTRQLAELKANLDRNLTTQKDYLSKKAELEAKGQGQADKSTARDQSLDIKEQDAAWKELGMTSTTALQKQLESAQLAREQLRLEGASTQQLGESLEKVLQDQIALNTAQGKGSNDEMIALANIKIQMKFQDDALNSTAKAYTALTDGLMNTFDTIGSKIMQSISHAKNFGDAMKQIGNSIKDELLGAIGKAFDELIKGFIANLLIVKSAQAAAATASISTSASEGAAAAFASVMEAVPYPANLILAPQIAAYTLAAIEAFNIAAFETGGDIRRTQIAMVHAGETVLSAGQTSKMGAMIDNGELSAKGSDRGGDTHIHINGATKSLMDEVWNYGVKQGRRSGVSW